jgi:hypothetical protein
VNEFFNSSEAQNAGVVDGIDDIFSASRKVDDYRNRYVAPTRLPADYHGAKGLGTLFIAFIGIGASAVIFLLGLSVARDSLVASGVLVTVSFILAPVTVIRFIKNIQLKKPTYLR